jgi:hypothetical protein
MIMIYQNLLRKYKEDYLIEEIQQFIPDFEIEQLKKYV